MTVELLIAIIALGVGVGTFIGLCLHIGYSDDFSVKECSIDYLIRSSNLRDEVYRLKSLNNDVASQNVYYREKNNKLEEENKKLKKRQAEVSNYLKNKLQGQMNIYSGTNLACEQGMCIAYKRVLDDIVYLEKEDEA